MRVGALLVFIFVAGCMKYDNLGVTRGKLNDCPEYPNCVNSQAQPSDKTHFIAPISYKGDLSSAREKLKTTILSFDRTTILTSDSVYIHAVFTSKMFRFVDDVEFYFESEPKVIHVRSASRVGMGDHGVNRERIEGIRLAFEK